VKYFSYGSNMDRDQMERRCPEAEFLGPAILPGCSFLINRRGVATVIPSTGKVHGVLWEISTRDGRKLARFEGEAHGYYLKSAVWIESSSLGRIEAIIYLATDLHPGKARDGYLESILKTATDHHFPADYITSLASWQDYHPAKPELPR